MTQPCGCSEPVYRASRCCACVCVRVCVRVCVYAGNILVQRGADGAAQLVRVRTLSRSAVAVRLSSFLSAWTCAQVILDHGMYRSLDPSFRASYCRLWQALILQDGALLQQSADELGVGQYTEVRARSTV